MATLTVVVPAYNEEATIGACLDHLLEQTRPVDEIIVVDNASSDQTRQIVEGYRARFPQVRLIGEPRPGVAYARRTGYDAATGEIIARTDGDTLVGPTWAEGIVEVLGSDDARGGVRVDGVTGPASYWGGGRATQWYERLMLRGTLMREGGYVPSMVGFNCAIRARCWPQLRDGLSYRPDIWDDADLSLEMRERGMRVFFHPAVNVRTSLRQVRHSPWANRKYMLGGVRTASARRDRRMLAMMIIEFPFRVVFTSFLWLLFRPWDEQKQNWRPYRLVTPLTRERSLITEGRDE
jgi:glycosyltransferase involved in cell wall biosynthesis